MEYKCDRGIFFKKKIIVEIVAIVFPYTVGILCLLLSCASKGIKGFYPPKLIVKDLKFDEGSLVVTAENFTKIQICIDNKCEIIPESSVTDSKVVVKFESGVESVKFTFWGFGRSKEEIYVNIKERKIHIRSED